MSVVYKPPTLGYFVTATQTDKMESEREDEGLVFCKTGQDQDREGLAYESGVSRGEITLLKNLNAQTWVTLGQPSHKPQ